MIDELAVLEKKIIFLVFKDSLKIQISNKGLYTLNIRYTGIGRLKINYSSSKSKDNLLRVTFFQVWLRNRLESFLSHTEKSCMVSITDSISRLLKYKS